MENKGTTIKKIVHALQADLSGLYGDREAGQLISILFRHFTGMNRADLQLKETEEISSDLAGKIMQARDELMKFRPVQYIIGMTEFIDLPIRVAPGVLIPRPETEEMVQLVIRENRQFGFQEISMLDIGTGSGCIAIALKKKFPCAKVDAIDKSPAALKIAASNADLNKVTIRLMDLDILNTNSSDTLPGYHLIVTNPPYVTEDEKQLMSPNVLDFEPADALFVPPEDPLLFCRTIGLFALRHLIRPGTLYMEINERYGKEITQLMISLGFDRVEVLKDIAGRNRFVRAEAKHNMADTSYWMVDKNLP